MTAALRDAPGGPEFIGSCNKMVSDMALAFVGEPDDKVRAHLGRLRNGPLQTELEGLFGADAAGKIIDAAIGAIIAHKRELEAHGSGSA